MADTTPKTPRPGKPGTTPKPGRTLGTSRAKKITLDELNARMADPNVPEKSLAPYFRTVESTQPMAPTLLIDETMVEVARTADARARTSGLLNGANWICRRRRELLFRQRIGSGTYKGPVVVSEGDSWFQYPFVLEDVIDWLVEDYAVFSLGAGGDTLQNMAREMEPLGALEDTGGTLLLLSGGGNDIVAGGNLAAHLRRYDGNPAMRPADFLLPSFDRVVDEAIGLLDRMVRSVARRFPDVAIACHGYDYVVPVKGGKWLGAPMATRDIVDPRLQKAIAAVMIDRFNAKLHLLAKGNARLTHIDCRGVVGDQNWYDELHPTDAGFRKVAKLFKGFIAQHAKKPRTVVRGVRSAPPTFAAEAAAPLRPAGNGPLALIRDAPPAAAVPLAKGRSLHLGLNGVDPAHYAGWDGALAACEADAEDMETVAKSLGYQTTKLLTAAATRDAVIAAIVAAADELESGDIFLMTVSSHGGQVPDFNNDEDDGLDETLCLYDAQLIDDELWTLWSKFRAGVRILQIADCCHSGSNFRAALTDQIGTARKAELGVPRFMPRMVAAKTARNNLAFYRKISDDLASQVSGSVTREMALPVAASLQAISGCQDNQLSYDGLLNGKFTGTLLEVWKAGAFTGDYDAFCKAIVERMPPEQTPKHSRDGQPDPAFATQRPFEI